MADNLYKETFSHVRSSYEFNMEDFEKPRTKKFFPVKKIVLIAAVAAVFAALGITASATGFFGLTEPEHEAPEIPVSADTVFVESYNGTDEAKAWDEFVWGNETQEDVAARYGLTVSGRSEVLTYEELTALQGGEIFTDGHTPAAADMEEDGSFRLEGIFSGSGGQRVRYELVRSVKGTMNYPELCHLEDRDIRPFDAGERTLALVEGGGETMLVTDLGDSWAAVLLRGTGLDEKLLAELGGSVDWERLAVVARPEFPEKAKPVTFGAGVELKEGNIIADQSFEVNLAGLGRVRFISYGPTEEFTDARFFFSADGKTSLSELTPVLTGLAFEKVAAVSFEDLTGDSFADILLLIDYKDGNGDAWRHVRIFTAVGNGNFIQETQISRNIEAAVENSRLDVAAVRAYLRSAHGPALSASTEGYAGILAENRKTGDDYFTRYTLYDLTGDGEPELFAGMGTCEADARWDIWTTQEGKARLLGSVNAFHAELYEADGELLRVSGHMGVETIDRISWDGENVVEETVSDRELGQFEDYAQPGRALLMLPAEDTSLVEPMSFEELIERTGELYAGPDSLAEYAFYDLNGDGGQELILRVESGRITDYRFYVLSQGRAVPLGAVPASCDNVLTADGTTLYLLEQDLESGSERIYTVTCTDTVTAVALSGRFDLSPADFTAPEKLGEVVKMTPAG